MSNWIVTGLVLISVLIIGFMLGLNRCDSCKWHKCKYYLSTAIGVLLLIGLTYYLYASSDLIDWKILDDFIVFFEKIFLIIVKTGFLFVVIYVAILFISREFYIKMDSFSFGGMTIYFVNREKLFKKSLFDFLNTKRSLFKFDPSRDNISEVLDSYFETYKFIRDKMTILESDKDEELYKVVADTIVLLNNFLTDNQTNYRRWYERNKSLIEARTISDLQNHYHDIDSLKISFQEFNKSFINLINNQMKLNIDVSKWD